MRQKITRWLAVIPELVVGLSLIQQPLAPLANAVTLATDKLGTVSKVYIEAAQDIIVSSVPQSE